MNKNKHATKRNAAISVAEIVVSKIIKKNLIGISSGVYAGFGIVASLQYVANPKTASMLTGLEEEAFPNNVHKIILLKAIILKTNEMFDLLFCSRWGSNELEYIYGCPLLNHTMDRGIHRLQILNTGKQL